MFSERLNKLRNEKGITLKEMADELNTTEATLSRYENGIREPKMEFIKLISNYFSVSTDYLLGESEERSRADEIKETISSDPELLEFWDKLNKREDLKDLVKEIKVKRPIEIRRIIKVIKAMDYEG